MHSCPAAHARPQPPQLAASVFESTQRSVQSVWLAGQRVAHMPV
jgi:hypothetical protein